MALRMPPTSTAFKLRGVQYLEAELNIAQAEATAGEVEVCLARAGAVELEASAQQGAGGGWVALKEGTCARFKGVSGGDVTVRARRSPPLV